MSSVFIITLALCTGLTTASLCMTKYTLGKSYLKYCSDRCCYYDSYFDPCCPAGYYVNISSSTISIGAIVGIVLGVAIVTFVTCCCFCEACTRKSSAGQILSRTQPSVAHTIRFRLRSHDVHVPLGQYNNGYLSTQPPPYSEVQTPTLTQLPPYSQGVQTTPLTQLPPYSQGVQTTPLSLLPPNSQGVQTYLQRQPPPYSQGK